MQLDINFFQPLPQPQEKPKKEVVRKEQKKTVKKVQEKVKKVQEKVKKGNK